MADTKSIKGTKTEVCLANAYVAESCAYSRYTFFSQSAQKESYFQVANIFAETAANELHHAKIFLKYLTEGAVMTAPIGVDPGILTPTVDNLKVAAAEEEAEGVEQYTKSAEIAREEGFPRLQTVSRQSPQSRSIIWIVSTLSVSALRTALCGNARNRSNGNAWYAATYSKAPNRRRNVPHASTPTSISCLRKIIID